MYIAPDYNIYVLNSLDVVSVSGTPGGGEGVTPGGGENETPGANIFG